ncbi:hypothetical protein FHU38_001139 [Saccharomonospora amisosensis]|uniref:Uncharacterized protein n=1 Tax=Saccharomonospora amisosensis TaxID=1128677 RepID=A0A7X5ZPZ3_9PSEU|nr:hypothetical protein [Saccharomonospora amisosensis]NIJ10795.1 hypothetical protein [Saccharomonospora amisosensis]
MVEIAFAELRGDVEVVADQARLAGRCYAGVVHVGDVFTAVEQPDGTGHEVSLRVQRIDFYGRDVPEISYGETAVLTVTGDGADRIVHRSILRGDAEPGDGRDR